MRFLCSLQIRIKMMKAAALLLLVSLAAGQQLLPAQPEEETPQQAPEEEETVHIGELRGAEHGIAGSLYAVDENILILKRFEYDGQADNAFFWVGSSTDGPSDVGTIVPYPFGGVFYGSEDLDAPFLYGVFNGSQDIRLTLPEGMKVTDLKWFSVWSRSGKKSLGEVIFPTGFSLAKRLPSGSSVNTGFGSTTQSFHSATARTTETYFNTNTDLPPPIVNAKDPRRFGEHDFAEHENDHDADAEPETLDDSDEGGHHTVERFQPRRNGASGIVASVSAVVMAVAVANFL